MKHVQMISSQINGDSKISSLLDIGYGVTQRVVDIINQCRYLASKRGMNLKELRLSMREDEAKQRKLVRHADICGQPLHYLSPTGQLHWSTTAYPTWFSHANNHGMIYSQYNMQNYGNLGLSAVVTDPWLYHVTGSNHLNQVEQRESEYNSLCKKRNSTKEKDNKSVNFSSESNIFKKGLTTQSFHSETKLSQNNDKLVNLLYSANTSSKPRRMKTNLADRIHGQNRSSEITSADFAKGPITLKSRNSLGKSLDASESSLMCNLPARKLASHNLVSLHAGKGDVEEEIVTKTIGILNSSSILEFNRNDDSDSESEFSEIQVVEEIDREKRVVSPLIKKVESAFADLQKSDALFGTMDDFGSLMSRANHIL